MLSADYEVQSSYKDDDADEYFNIPVDEEENEEGSMDFDRAKERMLSTVKSQPPVEVPE